MVIIKSKIESKKAGDGLVKVKQREVCRMGISVAEQRARRYVCNLIVIMAVVTHDFVQRKDGDFAAQLTKFSN